MREKLIFLNENGERIEFSAFSDYWVNIARDVKGLNDNEYDLYINDISGKNASVFLGYKTKEKNIRIAGSLYTSNPLRRQKLIRRLNRALLPHGNNLLLYQNGSLTRSIRCNAEEAPRYVRGEALEGFTIHLKCLDKYWKSGKESNSLLASWHDGFEFPIEIPQEGMEFGTREGSLIINVYNDGDVESPMFMRFSATGAVRRPKLVNVNTGEFFCVDFEMQYGDEIEVNTATGSKRVTLRRNGQTSNLMNRLEQGSTFLLLKSGDNLYRYDAESGLDNLNIMIKHSNLYVSCFGE